MMIFLAKTARSQEELIPSLDPAPDNEELIEEEDDKNQIPKKLTKEYFEKLNSSVLPF